MTRFILFLLLIGTIVSFVGLMIMLTVNKSARKRAIDIEYKIDADNKEVEEYRRSKDEASREDSK